MQVRLGAWPARPANAWPCITHSEHTSTISSPSGTVFFSEQLPCVYSFPWVVPCPAPSPRLLRNQLVMATDSGLYGRTCLHRH